MAEHSVEGDDTISEPYCLSHSINFFDNKIDQFCVSVNGYIAMGHCYSTYHPESNPLASYAMVAPFLTDVDTRGSGTVRFREDRSPGMLERIGKKIQNSGRSPDFMPTLLIIANWNSVGYYNSKGDKTNTFSAMVASDGDETHVILQYNSINWTSPDNKNGKNGRLDGSNTSMLPLAGVSDGHGRQEMVGSGGESFFLNLPRNGNTGNPGEWIFTTNEAPRKEIPKPPEKETQNLKDERPKESPPREESNSSDEEDSNPPTTYNKSIIAKQIQIFAHPDYPFLPLSAADPFKVAVNPGDGYDSEAEDLGLAIFAPKGFAAGKVGLETWAAFGGPYYGNEYYEPISPTFLIKESTEHQQFNKDISFTFKTGANIEPQELDDVYLMKLELTDLSKEFKAYRSRLVDLSMGRVELSSETARLSVRDIIDGDLRLRVVKKIRPTREDYLQKTKFMWTGDATAVVMTGSFTDWQGSKVLEQDEDGSFVTYFDLPLGTHQYKFVVDGEWTHDDKKPAVPDGQGGLNNVIEITEDSYQQACEEITRRELKKSMRFAATFYNTVVRDVNHDDLLPFSIFSVYPDQPIHIKRAKELMTGMIEHIDHKLDSGLNPPGWTNIQLKDDNIVVTNSKLNGWTALKSMNPPEINFDAMRKMLKKFEHFELKKNQDFSEYNDTYPALQIKFRKTKVSGLSVMCTLTATGFDKSCGTDVDFLMASIKISADPTIINGLRMVIIRFNSLQEVYQFGLHLGIPRIVLETKQDNVGPLNQDSDEQIDEIYGSAVDKLCAFRSSIYSFIEKNSITLGLNHAKIEEALLNIGRPDLAESMRSFHREP